MGDEDQTAIAHANLIPRLKRGRMVDATSVEEGSVLRGDIMQLTAVAGMNDHRAMPARNVRIRQNDVVIRQPPHGIKTHMQRKSRLLIHQHKFGTRGQSVGWELPRGLGRIGLGLTLHDHMSLVAAGMK